MKSETDKIIFSVSAGSIAATWKYLLEFIPNKYNVLLADYNYFLSPFLNWEDYEINGVTVTKYIKLIKLIKN